MTHGHRTFRIAEHWYRSRLPRDWNWSRLCFLALLALCYILKGQLSSCRCQHIARDSRSGWQIAHGPCASILVEDAGLWVPRTLNGERSNPLTIRSGLRSWPRC